MIKVLVADDEEIVRTSLVDMIPWQELGMVLVGSVRNGLEALDVVSDDPPDIVITDIRMPMMDGLELIEKIKMLSPDTEIIILSGFSEFSYAQKAMSYGVKHYLLKPTRKEDLTELLRKISYERTDNGALRYSYQLERLMLLDAFSDPSSIRHSLCLLGINPDAKASISTTGDSRTPFFRPVMADGRAYAFVPDSSPNAVSIERLIASFVSSHTLGQLSIEGDDGSFRKLWSGSEENVGKVSAEYAKALEEGRSSEELNRKIGEILSPLPPLEAALLLIRIVSSASLGDGYLPALLATGVLDAKSTDDVIKIAYEILGRRLGTDKKGQNPVSIIISYIEKHIDDEGISLKWLSDNVVYMDAGYLSKLFVKETGIRFSDYLSRMRIEHAKSLMKLYDSSTVQEIAEKSGFGDNPRYFSQVFRKYEKMTPSEYLAKQRGQR